MAENTNIEWCDHTFNPWWGCTAISPACDNCYAAALDKRTGGDHWGAGRERRRTRPHNWAQPVRWNADHAAFFAKHGRRQRVFCASMADVFDNAVPNEWRADLFKLIADTPNLDWLLLTKRIGNVSRMIPFGWQDFGVPHNVWLGATICNQQEAERDVPKLLRTPARLRFLSIEPILGPIDLKHLDVGLDAGEMDALTPHTWDAEVAAWRDSAPEWENDFEDWFGSAPGDKSGPMHSAIDWVIVGGESGPGARPMHPDWACSLRDQCAAADVPFLFKQWGEWCTADQHPDQTGDNLYTEDLSRLRHPCLALGLNGRTAEDAELVEPRSVAVHRVGKKSAGRLLDGRTHDVTPAQAMARPDAADGEIT